MGLGFAVGSMCFLVGPFPGYLQVVGAHADAMTFFVGSVFFTLAGGVQTWLAWSKRRGDSSRRAALWSAGVQSAGTLFFNVSTFHAVDVAVSDPQYSRLVWRPDWRGSVCFLVSGALAYAVAPRRGWRPLKGNAGWWQPTANLLGCVFFGAAAVAGYVVPSTGSVLSLAAANWNTCLGAACFLACAIEALRIARSRASDDAAAPALPNAGGSSRREEV